MFESNGNCSVFNGYRVCIAGFKGSGTLVKLSMISIEMYGNGCGT